MANNVDQRVVEMKFDNGQFQKGVSGTLSLLDKLKSALSFDGAKKGLADITSAGKKFNLDGMGAGIQGVAAKFSALQVAGVAALGTLVSKATSAGLSFAKSFTIQPITDGFGEYETKLGAIQTILTNTARYGTSLDTVNVELNKLNTYADKTIYSFSEMTKNASLFTNSGMRIEDATSVIKGFSNAAAASGTSADDAARAAYQMSQAISAGVVKAQDWISVTNAGMGGKNMQESLINVAKGMGTFKGSTATATLASTNFKGSLEKGWLTADVMSTYLKAMSGDMTDAQLAAKGLNAEQIKTLQSQAKMGLDAATKVRTLTALMGTLKEAVGSGWSQSFEIIFGGFNEATNLFTNLSNTIGGMINKSANARNKVLQDWKNDNGRHFFLEGIKNGFIALAHVVGPIKDAFRELFPATTGKQLADLSEKFMHFTQGLIAGGDTMQRIKSTFEGVFSIIRIGVDIVSGFIRVLFGMFSTASAGGAGILAVTAVIGEFIRKIADFIQYTGAIDKFFTVLLSPLLLLKPLISLISDLAIAINSLLMGDVSGFTSNFGKAFSNFGGAIGDILDKFKGLALGISVSLGGISTFFSGLEARAKASGNGLVSTVASALSAFSGFLSSFFADARGTINNLIATLTSAGDTGKNFLAGFGGSGLSLIVTIVDALIAKFQSLRDKMDFSGVFARFNSGAGTVASGGASALGGAGELMGSIFHGLSSMLSGVSQALAPFLSSLSAFFTTVVEKLRGYIQSLDMQDAVAVLNTGFLIALYMTLRKFLSNMTGLIGKIGDVFDKIGSVFGQLTATLKTMQQDIRANIILKIAIAVGILVGAILLLSRIDGEALKKALIALTVLFTQVAAMLFAVTKISPTSITSSAAGMILMATAIRILAGAVKTLGELDSKTLYQGGIALGVLMASVAGMVVVLNNTKGIFQAAAGMLLLSVALNAMIAAILLYSRVDWGTMASGLTKMTLTLVALGVAMSAFPPGMVGKAAGLVILSGALVVLAGVITLFGSLPLGIVVKGLISLAAAMAIMVIAANAMTGGLAGAAAMVIMAGAVAILVPALAALGSLDFMTLVKGIGAFLVVMAIFVAAIYLLTPVVPVLAAVAGSVALLGVAILAAGAGFALFVAGLAGLVVVGVAGFTALVAGIHIFLAALPLMIQQFGLSIIAFASVIKSTGPKVIEAFGTLLVAFVDEVAKVAPKIFDAGIRMILGFLKAIRDHVGEVVTVVGEIIKNFIKALDAQLGGIISAGYKFILSFIEGLASAIRGNKEKTGQAGADLAKAIVEGVISGLKALGGTIGPWIKKMAQGLVDAFKNFLGIHSPSTVFEGFGKNIVEGLINGIGSLIGSLASKATAMASSAVSAAKKAVGEALSVGREFVGKVIGGLSASAGSLLAKHIEVVRSGISAAKGATGAALSIGEEVVQGMIRGIGNGIGAVASAAKNLAKSALDSAKGFLGIHSPSREFIKVGEFVHQGFVQGLTSGSAATATTAYNTMRDMLSAAMKAASEDIASYEEKLTKLTSARTKDAAAIAKVRGEIAASKNELALASAAHKELTSNYVDEERKITSLSAKYTALSTKLQDAQKVLADAKKTRDDYAKTVKDQYATLPDITPESDVYGYVEDVRKKVEATKTFATVLQKLRDMGLNDATYSELLAKGVDALPFAQKLADMGPTAVTELNRVSRTLQDESAKLGNAASKALYQAGVDSAAGIVKGLQSQQSAIIKQIEALATAMLKALKKKLGIKSPSREFAKLGGYSVAGLSQGFRDGIGEVTSSAEFVASESVKTMQKTLSRLSDGFSANMDLNPTISPVLDLTDIKKNAATLGKMFDGQSIQVGSGYSGATAASNGYNNNRTTVSDQATSASSEPTKVEFNQYNTSPKALSPAEIYRNTKNQLSVARGALV